MNNDSYKLKEKKRKMKMLKSKTMAILIAAFLTISMGASMILLPSAGAHSPPWQIPTYSFCSVSPNPIGIGQQVNVNFWVNEPPPTASAQYGDRYHNMTVIVTHPDGTKETLGPFSSDATGGSHTTFTPSVTGNYSFQFVFGGDTITDENPATPITNPSQHSASYLDYFMPSVSNVFTLAVQQSPISYAAVSPLPTNYWTRPIYGENNNWYSVAGNWLGLAASTFAATGMYNATGNYNPYTTAPNSAHILWTKPEAFGGIIGGEFGGSETGNYYSTSQYEPKFAPIIMNGILYYTLYPGASTYPEGWVAVDLHTGQTIWTKTEAQTNNEVLKCGQILNEITPNQYGAEAYLWSVPIAAAGFMAGGSYMSMYDAMTGQWILNITGTPSMTLVEGTYGDLIGYYTTSDATGTYLNMWNSTACINLNVANYGGGANVADQWMWRPPQGGQLNFTLGVQHDSHWPAKMPANDKTNNATLTVLTSMFGMVFPSYLLGISAVQSGVIFTSGTASTGFAYTPGWYEEAGFDQATGALLWGPFNVSEVPYSIIYTGGNWASNGARVELTESSLSVTGYSLTTGAKLWGPTALPNASPFSSLGANCVPANGIDYIWGYGGDVYAYNTVTGALLWQYHTPSGGYESPYGVEPLWTFSVGTVADGKLFVPEGHMYSPPLFHNAQQLALNITDGSVIWSMDAFDVTSAPAISDGIMTTLNAYDNQIYAWGKGPTDTTVSAQPYGSDIMISGSVTDVSAGAQQDAVAKNFPNGLPAVSDASQSAWMEYVYMQQTRPSNATGVPVTLSVIDSNGNLRDIGSATSDSTGKFNFLWTPNISGKYTIIATFAGSESYYSSYDEAFFNAAAATPSPSPYPVTVLPATEMYIAAAAVAIIIAIAIVGVLTLMAIRKRP